jgi:predicted transcriptional regulator
VANLTITKKVRMDRATAQRLARVARATNRSEGEVLRDGIDLAERESRRSQAIDELIAMIDGPEPPKIRFRMK